MYGAIDYNQFQSLNPAQQNDMARAAGYTGTSDYLDHLNGGMGGNGGTSGGVNTAEDEYNNILREFLGQFDKLGELDKEFQANNPFVFDELLAKKSAEESYNPYYDAELKDFTQGIERQKQSQEGSMKLLTDLNRIQVGQDKRNLDEAISAAEEGYAGAGLYNSGAKERATGQAMVSGQDIANTRSLQYNESMAGGQRSLDEIAQNRATGIRNLETARTTDIQTAIKNMKEEEAARHATERLQYLAPYSNLIQGGINELITRTWK